VAMYVSRCASRARRQPAPSTATAQHSVGVYACDNGASTPLPLRESMHLRSAGERYCTQQDNYHHPTKRRRSHCATAILHCQCQYREQVLMRPGYRLLHDTTTMSPATPMEVLVLFVRGRTTCSCWMQYDVPPMLWNGRRHLGN